MNLYLVYTSESSYIPQHAISAEDAVKKCLEKYGRLPVLKTEDRGPVEYDEGEQTELI